MSTDHTPSQRYLPKPFYGSSHWWAERSLSNLDQDAKVLDVGAGSGVMADVLESIGIRSRYAIEIDEQTREGLADRYVKTAASLESLNEDRFSCVLLLDVLEHMAEPEEFLRQLERYLEPDAQLLLSLPNIAHWSIRLSLLAGRFEYGERGILDRTHLQFFTKRRVKQLAESGHYSLRTLSATIEPIEFLLPSWAPELPGWEMLSRLRLSNADLLPGLFAYQHVAILKYEGDR